MPSPGPRTPGLSATACHATARTSWLILMPHGFMPRAAVPARPSLAPLVAATFQVHDETKLTLQPSYSGARVAPRLSACTHPSRNPVARLLCGSPALLLHLRHWPPGQSARMAHEPQQHATSKATHKRRTAWRNARPHTPSIPTPQRGDREGTGKTIDANALRPREPASDSIIDSRRQVAQAGRLSQHVGQSDDRIRRRGVEV
mmetsp:Transcript_8836/g.21233  ORF Transcript_8836/g.21233 Transcript_8836/m.21233 type:complete len:203 (-) Transcript_8836:3-611(-)